MLRRIISEGLAIGAWVSLWVSLEMLIFKVGQHRLDNKDHSLISEMEITLAPLE